MVRSIYAYCFKIRFSNCLLFMHSIDNKLFMQSFKVLKCSALLNNECFVVEYPTLFKPP